MEKNDFLDSRKLEIYFQLDSKITELLEKNSGGFFLEGVPMLKTVCICVPFVYYYHYTKIDNNSSLTMF